MKFSVAAGADALADTASMADDHPGWDWEGKAYPKTERSHGPNMQSLDDHSEFLKVLIRLAPNGYADAYKLRDLLLQLHNLFQIFPMDESAQRGCHSPPVPPWHRIGGE